MRKSEKFRRVERNIIKEQGSGCMHRQISFVLAPAPNRNATCYNKTAMSTRGVEHSCPFYCTEKHHESAKNGRRG